MFSHQTGLESNLGQRLELTKAAVIPKVDIVTSNKAIFLASTKILRHFFIKGARPGAPLKGFLFEGPPGTGKTELAKQVARQASEWSIEHRDEVYLAILDGATIASPRWGDAESILRAAFSADSYKALSSDPRIILLFDDVESLLLARSSDIAKEWHFSINAVLFHLLDQVNPSRTFVIATTNRPDLVDEALRDRLYSFTFEPMPIDALMEAAARVLYDLGEINPQHRKTVLKAVKENLKALKQPSLRDVQRLVFVECIEQNVWEE